MKNVQFITCLVMAAVVIGLTSLFMDIFFSMLLGEKISEFLKVEANPASLIIAFMLMIGAIISFAVLRSNYLWKEDHK